MLGARCSELRRGVGCVAAGRGYAEGLGGNLGEEDWVVMESPVLVNAVFEWGERSHEGFRLGPGHSCATSGVHRWE